MNFKLPIAKGVVSAFDEILKDMHNLLLISRMHQTHEELPGEFKEAFQMYSKITENSTEDECFKMIKLLKDFSIKEESVAKGDKETAIKDFYQNFRKFRDLVERKMALPLQEWKDTKWDLMYFSKTYETLQQQLEDVRNSVEKARMIKNKEIFEQETKEKCERKMDLASEDFKSLQPFSIIANSEEHMDRISAIREIKLEDFKDRLKIAEQDLQQTVTANKKEIQTIIEESIETKSFIEWIEEKNYKTLKELEVKIKEEWNAFSSEVENSRNLGKTYAEKHAIYLDIKRQEDHEERLGKQDAAATLLQAHWRGYMTRRRLRGDTLF